MVNVNEVILERGKILVKFQYIESLLKDYIANHYFSDNLIKDKFSQEVLEDENFPFFLLRKIFQKNS